MVYKFSTPGGPVYFTGSSLADAIQEAAEKGVDVSGCSSKVLTEASIMAQGENALLLDILEVFPGLPGASYARNELSRIIDGLAEQGKQFQAVGDIGKYTALEIAGPQARYCGNKTKLWLGSVAHKFSVEHQLTGY